VARYLILIYGNEHAWAALPEAWHAANADRHEALIASAGPAILGVSELEPTARSVSIRADASGKATVTEGPFHETAEIVGGYYVLEAANLAEAIRLASQIPEATAAHGGVEIRPIRPVAPPA
jgi:hypothetical protein